MTLGQADPDSRFKVDADAPLVVIPHTGVIWKISRTNNNHGHGGHDDDDDHGKDKDKDDKGKGNDKK